MLIFYEKKCHLLLKNACQLLTKKLLNFLKNYIIFIKFKGTVSQEKFSN